MQSSKRLTSPQQVIDLIDRFIKEMNDLSVSASETHKLADALRFTNESFRIEKLRSQASQYERRIGWRQTRIKNLKEKLAELQTPELPGCESDGSIPSS